MVADKKSQSSQSKIVLAFGRRILGLCIVWMIRYDTYRDTFDPIHDTYRRYVSDQIYDVTRHIFDKLVCTMLFITSALLRLECTIDCISGSVGHHQNVFPFIF